MRLRVDRDVIPSPRAADREGLFDTKCGDVAGNGTVDGQRLYQLVRQGGAIRDRDFAIEFLDPGVQAFSFTFG